MTSVRLVRIGLAMVRSVVKIERTLSIELAQIQKQSLDPLTSTAFLALRTCLPTGEGPMPMRSSRTARSTRSGKMDE